MGWLQCHGEEPGVCEPPCTALAAHSTLLYHCPLPDPKPCVHPQGRAGFAPWQPYGSFSTATGRRESEGTGTDPQPPRTAEDARSPIACWGFRAPREPPRATDSLNKGPHHHEGLQSLPGQARPYHRDVNKPQRQQQHPKDKTPLHGSTSLRQQHGPGAAPSPT